MTYFLFIFDSPTQIVFVILIIALLFGASRLPQLAKSLGQTRAMAAGLTDHVWTVSESLQQS